MADEEDFEDVPTVEDYFYYIPPTGSSEDIAIRRRFRYLTKTYYNLDDVAKHMESIMPSNVKQALIQIDFDHTHPMALFLLMSMFSAYGINEDNYPYLVNTSMNQTMAELMFKVQHIIVPDPNNYI